LKVEEIKDGDEVKSSRKNFCRFNVNEVKLKM